MLSWLKTVALLGVSVLLMGSKLIVQVPPGGSVVSSSGLVACAAGETCTVEIDEDNFAEAFTAVAEPGYAFERWADRAGALCRGSHDPYCAELDSGPFSDFAGSGARLRGGATVTMTPSFTALTSSPVGSGPRFSINSYHVTRYYQVRGNTQEEVWAQLHGKANPLAVDDEAGTKPLGHASFDYRYHYQGGYASDGSGCLVESGELEFRFETVLPQLAGSGASGEPLRDRWQPFQERITEHEAGHHAIYRELVTELPQVLAELGEVPCGELDERVRLAVDDAVGAVRQASADYDAHYGGEARLASSL